MRLKLNAVAGAVLSFCCVAWAQGLGESRVLPVPIETPPPMYPAGLLAEGVEGNARLVVIVGPSGVVWGAQVASSSDGRFDQACIDAASRWTFKPALMNGSPVKRACCMHVEFREGKVSVRYDADPAQASIPPRLLHKVEPDYRNALIFRKTSGTLSVQFIVDTEGNVREAHLVQSTHRALGGPALEAVRQWKFFPGVKDGAPVNVRMAQDMSATISFEKKKKVKSNTN